jgi:L-ribulokinase
VEAAQQMPRLKKRTFAPAAQNQRIYRRLYQEYALVHDYFGRGQNDVMKRLKALRQEVRSGGQPEQ